MAAVVSNRLAVSATLLLALIVTGGCLAMASPVPVANGRRLQQLDTSGGLTSQLQALPPGLHKISDQLQSLLETVPLPSDLQAQLQRVLTSFALALSELQTILQGLLNLQLLDQHPAVTTVLKKLLNQLATKLDALSKKVENSQPDGGCFRDLQASLKAAISDLTSQLNSNTAGIPMQPVDLIAALRNLANAVGLVDPCTPGLQKLLSNGLGVLGTIGELVAGIRQ